MTKSYCGERKTKPTPLLAILINFWCIPFLHTSSSRLPRYDIFMVNNRPVFVRIVWTGRRKLNFRIAPRKSKTLNTSLIIILCILYYIYIYIYIELNQTLKSAITRYACSLTTGIYILTITDWYYYKRRPPARQYNGSDNLFAFATAIVVRGFIITRNQHSRAFRSRKW